MQQHTIPIILCLFVSGMGLPAMGQTKASAPSSQTNVRASLQIEELGKEVLDLKREVDALKTRVDLDEYILGTKQPKTDTISLDLTQSAYQRLDTDNGFFLVSVDEATPYLSGYKLHLSIGNPSFATYTNYKITVKWSRPYDWGKYTEASYQEWNKAIQEKELAFPESLQPGSWNSVDVILAPVSPDQLGYLTLSMTTNTVSLHRR
jgi:hypothetical protein